MNPYEPIEGWIELGNFAEAAEELHKLQPGLKSTVEFIRLWVRIYSATKAWSNVEVMCETLLKHDPENAFALFHRAEALHQQGNSKDAILSIGETEYGRKTAQGLYNLARYLCGDGQFGDALTILGMAFDRDKTLRKRAKLDPDLQAIRFNLQEG